MKHLFVINSHITALCALSIIELRKLQIDEVVILTMRGAKLKDTRFKHVDFIYPHIVNPIPQTRNVLKARKVLKEFDIFIAKITEGKEFYCYVNHNMARNTELMINHPLCNGFSIMEEGAAAYNSADFFKKKYSNRSPSIWDRVGYKNRIRKRYFYRPDYDNVYAVTSLAFPGFENKIVLEKILSNGDSSYSKYNNTNILVFDGAVTLEMIDIESFIEGLERFLSNVFNNDMATVFYKFHPVQPTDERLVFEKYFASKKTINFIKLPDEAILEEMISVAKNLKMYFNVSTISIYANALGHQCYSFSNILCSISKIFSDKIKDMNDVLKRSTIQVEDIGNPIHTIKNIS
ncbi:polysialyltransferase family glycosyltransferase [Paracnuella aquatica]|uniref:polysialyltransferase family glycosyltransferase n=1 Tax=Paracnuella aquatica TaxID=2268757 RepID=UPI000F507F3D|nr:polysialyltransferase family glycosyltransferase [Paracnuella aquatica]RPD45526.1 hypothetical protein DRJ53_15075 [Paracnuella aquatica]